MIDLGWGIAGGYATKLLADAGADVVKVELPDGDPLRAYSASFAPIDDHGPLFGFLNTTKQGVVLDYRTTAGARPALGAVRHRRVGDRAVRARRNGGPRSGLGGVGRTAA